MYLKNLAAKKHPLISTFEIKSLIADNKFNKEI